MNLGNIRYFFFYRFSENRNNYINDVILTSYRSQIKKEVIKLQDCENRLNLLMKNGKALMQ